MMYYYNTDQFDQWYQDFEKITGCKVPADALSRIEAWTQTEEPLSSIFKMEKYSISAECCFLSDDVIVKTSYINMMAYLKRKLESHPILESYIIPTFIYYLPNRHNLDETHINMLNEQDRKNVARYSDCLILQQRCNPYIKEENHEYMKWYKEQKDICNLLEEYKVDLTYHNAGWINGQIKYFDW